MGNMFQIVKAYLPYLSGIVFQLFGIWLQKFPCNESFRFRRYVDGSIEQPEKRPRPPECSVILTWLKDKLMVGPGWSWRYHHDIIIESEKASNKLQCKSLFTIFVTLYANMIGSPMTEWIKVLACISRKLQDDGQRRSVDGRQSKRLFDY